MKRTPVAAALAAVLITTTACGGNGGTSAANATSAHGPISIWYSNNAQEVAWGKQMVDAWNAAHPNEKITAQEIPTGKSSEEVIGAAITAGNEPCLILNTAPAAVPQFQKQGGLVALDDFPDGKSYVETRTGTPASQYKSSDGKYYQLPWKSNPVMIFYNKKEFTQAGIDTTNPPLKTYDEFVATAQKVVSSGAAQYAIWPAPTSEFYQPWFDFYPLFAAQSGGKQLLDGKKSQFTSDAGQQVAQFWRTLYADKLASQETYNGDAFADGKSAMAIVGPWAIAVYQGKVDWGVVPVPTKDGMPADQIHTFSDAKNIAMYASCKNRATAWDVMKYATSQDQDGKLLQMTGQMPMRANLPSVYPDYFAQNPAYVGFAAQAGRTVEVPNVSNSVAIWQAFRDAYSKSVIFGKQDPKDALNEAAQKIDGLAAQS
jgi:multiple sugar transport system substrate-binding protein